MSPNMEFIGTLPFPKALRTHILRHFGPKYHTIEGFWAILSLRE